MYNQPHAQWTWLDLLWMILMSLRVCAGFVHVPKSWEGVLTRCTEPLVTVPTIWARADVSTAAIGLRQVVTGLGTHRFLDNEGESYGTTGASSTIGAIGSSTNGTTSSRTTEPLSSLPGVYGGSSCDHATSPPACSSPSWIFDRLV